ncbi:hypothetical protein C8Q79DRAFT_1007292 [Trametes meyenii]|nr:hypothetical protein C8Q79DRAFT_1007292 [Trametes meyenii]
MSSTPSGTANVSGGVFTASPAQMFHIPSLSSTYGAVLIGTFFGLILYGAVLHQSYRYVRSSSSDSKTLKSFVAFIVILDTYYTIISMHISYWYLVANYFTPQRLFKGIWSINLLPVSTSVEMILCQCFFARRVYVVVAIIGVMFLAELSLAAASMVKAFTLPDLTHFSKVVWLDVASFVITVVSDVTLTSILVWVLRQSRTGFKRTDSMIDVLIAYSVCTGLITDVFNIICLLTAALHPGDLIYAGTAMVGTKLYVICVLASLNSRKMLTAPRTEDKVDFIGMSTIQNTGSSASGSERWGSVVNKAGCELEKPCPVLVIDTAQEFPLPPAAVISTV